jgi:dolichol-phosphate mannosyltransferase
MARVSLILPTTPQIPFSPARVHSFQSNLEQGGHSVEVLLVTRRADVADSEGVDPNWRWIEPKSLGVAAAAADGLRAAVGDFLLVLDPNMGYEPADLSCVIGPLARDKADLAIASRFATDAENSTGVRRLRPSSWISALARGCTGTSDPLSGLIGLTRELYEQAAEDLNPAGTKFAIELLLRAGGRCVEVPVQTCGGPLVHGLRLQLDDFRQLKRLADHRYGNFSRLFQFCVVGASGMVVDLTCYAGFQWLFERTWMAGRTAPVIGGALSLAVAGVLAVAIALIWNFMWNRRLTFNYARHGSILGQFLSYALSNLLGISLSLALRLTLPRYFGFFDEHKLAAAVVGIITATGISFSMSRWVVFRHQAVSPPSSPSLEELDAIPASPLGE